MLRDGLFLVADNTQASRINGNRLAQVSPALQEANSVASMSAVVRCEARRNSEKGHNRKAASLRNIRKALHLCVGARVMLQLNAIWDVGTVPLGLMNGARGVIVATLYAAPDTPRTDGNALAGTGYPSCKSSRSSNCMAPPRGLDACPLPDFVVVHFPRPANERKAHSRCWSRHFGPLERDNRAFCSRDAL